LDRDSVCKILRDDTSPTVQLVGCNEKLPSTPLSTKAVEFLTRTWIWIVSFFHALMASQIAKGLKIFVDRFIIPSISLIWAFFSTMWPSNDPALNQPAPNPQVGEGAEEIRIVRRIDTAGQRRCRSLCVCSKRRLIVPVACILIRLRSDISLAAHSGRDAIDSEIIDRVQRQ
jgi:hypothetical protein